jgi:hypothetical protein
LFLWKKDPSCGIFINKGKEISAYKKVHLSVKVLIYCSLPSKGLAQNKPSDFSNIQCPAVRVQAV